MWYLIFRKSKLMGRSQSMKDARRIAYKYCTKAYPRIQIYEQSKEWGGKLYYDSVKYIVEFDIRHFEITGKKRVYFYTDYEDQHGLLGKQLRATGDLYSSKPYKHKDTRPYKRLIAKHKSGEISPIDFLMGLNKGQKNRK